MSYVAGVSRSAVMMVGLIALGAACGPSVQSDDDGTDGGGGPCGDGAMQCEGNQLLVCQDGAFVDSTVCADACDPLLGCVACRPGTGSCSGDTSTVCNATGTGYEEVFCDPLQGLSCFETGVCEGACAPQNIGQNYIGCNYYPTVTGNEVDGLFKYAVAVSNTTAEQANVHIEGGALGAPITFTVGPNSVAVRELPWEPTLKACTSSGQLECGAPQNLSALVTGGAYHLRSTRPVTVYQFNPLNYEIDNTCVCDGFTCQGCSFTNDASLLLPVNAMTPNYFVASYPFWTVPGFLMPGLVAVTGTVDGTQVTITTKAATAAGAGVPAFSAGSPQMVTLNAGDVVQLFTTTGDLTGTSVSATAPVQVIGGHYCTQVPNGTPACDHMEESMFPLETLTTRYLVTAPAVPAMPNGKIQIIRIVATAAGTTLTFDPDQGSATTLANPGDFIEIANNAASFEINANHRILVAQYMEGQGTGATGDPAMALAIPVDQYRLDYQFHAPVNYETNYVNVTAPMTATVMLDASPIPALTAIGTSGFGVARVQVSNAGTGDHTIAGTEPFGISVYGYGQFTSFWYPGGLDLVPIPID